MSETRKLILVLFFVGILFHFSEQKPAAAETSTTTDSTPFHPAGESETDSSSEKTAKNSSDIHRKFVPPVSEDIPFDPSLILARSVRDLGDSMDSKFVPERNEHFGMPEDADKTLRRLARSAEQDLDAAEDGFVIRPLFKYRQEQRRSEARRYRSRDSGNYYPRYPIFPGK
ncbi:uncharacterized protein LOC124410211 [Diprion similis]|uniref:uncharacterized protein LOC124410211 n=1 Tax=Diprion similis TaxID=362088 RepID=UPI001EF7B9B9|nr:uncharacterized protein LOC124410211 [Diprion similis]